MSDPLTTEGLYGKSPEKPLVFEETPVIDPIPVPETPKLSPPHDLPLPRKKSHIFTNILVFTLLFIAGIWLSSYLRQYLPSGLGDAMDIAKTTPGLTPTPTRAPSQVVVPTIADSWKTYQVISGITKKPIDGVTFKLPSDILPPICDGSGCASQGTYLPGGTRFTVAARGAGQSLRDYRGTTISDVNGTIFTTKNMTVSGVEGMEFTGTFSGRTISGYAFATMRGVMIPLSATASLEINHFTPSGITADFASDDALFNTILSKVELSAGSSQKGATPGATVR